MATTHTTRAARRIARIARIAAGLLVAAGAFGTAAGRSTGQEIGQPRVLVRAEGSEGGHAPLVRQAAARVSAALLARGIRVIDAELAERLLPAVGSGAGGGGLRAWGETLVEVGLRPEEERRQQGRYRVRDRLTLRITRLDDAALLLEESEVQAGVSFDGVLPAHREALDRLFAAGPQSLVTRAAAKLEELQTEETREGALFTITVHAGREDRNLAAALLSGVRGVAGVRADSVAPIRQESVPLGDGGKESLVEIRLRFQGASAGLFAAVLGIVAEGGTAEQPRAQVPPVGGEAPAAPPPAAAGTGEAARPAAAGQGWSSVDFVATPRRLVVFVRPGAPGVGSGTEANLDEVLGREVGQLLKRAAPLEAGGRPADLAVAVAPAEVPAPAGSGERRAALVRRITEAAAAAAGAKPADSSEPGATETTHLIVKPSLEKIEQRWMLGLAVLDAATSSPILQLSRLLAESLRPELEATLGS